MDHKFVLVYKFVRYELQNIFNVLFTFGDLVIVKAKAIMSLVHDSLFIYSQCLQNISSRLQIFKKSERNVSSVENSNVCNRLKY